MFVFANFTKKDSQVPEANADPASNGAPVLSNDSVQSDALTTDATNHRDEDARAPTVVVDQWTAPPKSKLTPEQNRSQQFRRTFPDVSEVPDELTKSEKKRAKRTIKARGLWGEPIKFTHLFNTEVQERARRFEECFPLVSEVPDNLTKPAFDAAFKAAQGRSIEQGIRFRDLVAAPVTTTAEKEANDESFKQLIEIARKKRPSDSSLQPPPVRRSRRIAASQAKEAISEEIK